MPNRWEVPGGGVDDEDPTVLHGVVRELWEEAGLIAVHVGSQIGDGHIFFTKSGKVVCKFNFLVDAKKDTKGETPVKLDPDEHQNYVWATEEEVKAHKCGGFELPFTTRAQEALVLHAFELRRKISQEKADSGA
jgi:8-oxo-dGTP pyrophosphatase MutT (NUDIX family)